MAKYYNNIKKTGRVGGSVFSIRGGVTIERAYNPSVLNPNTEAQISARGRLKLMSQLAAVLGSAIAIPRDGLRSSRNLFVAKNYGLSTFVDNQANVPITAVQLTNSNVALPNIGAERLTNSIAVYIANSDTVGTLDVSRIVYVMLSRDTDGRLRYVTSRVATGAGESNAWQVSFPMVSGQAYVLGYGVRDNTEVASVLFGNLSVPTAEAIARLIVTRRLLESDITLTETKGFTVPNPTTLGAKEGANKEGNTKK